MRCNHENKQNAASRFAEDQKMAGKVYRWYLPRLPNDPSSPD